MSREDSAAMGQLSTAAAGAALPLIAIIGRPNAGKSTLFNRLTRSQKAQVDAEPGVTRDRNVAEGRLAERRFWIMDTGGFDPRSESDIGVQVRAQSEIAIKEADAVIFLVDGRAGASRLDAEVVDLLRRAGKPFFVAVNKLDTAALDDDAADFFALGVDNVIPISAAHGRGVGDLIDAILEAVPACGASAIPSVSNALAVAIIGRPNVGKSSLVNRLLGYERTIVTSVAGTTRDPIDTPLVHGEREYVLVDTAGIRRRPRLRAGLERHSVSRALRALERADVAVLVIDASEGMTDQDARLASYAWERGRALIVAANKSDLIADKKRLQLEVRAQYPFLEPVTLLFVSARSGVGMNKVLPAVDRAGADHRRQLATAALNQVIHRAVESIPPPSVKGKRPNFKYAVQTDVRPPTITLFCSHPELVPESFTRFLVNRLRDEFDLRATPIRLRYRRGAPTEPRRRRR